jgi:hypothetical protein
MKFISTYPAMPLPLTEDEEAAKAQAETEAKAKRQAAETEAKAKRQAAVESQAEEEARANGATVSLSDKSLHALAADDQRVRRNIQWGIVRGLFLYTLFMIPIWIIVGVIVAASR